MKIISLNWSFSQNSRKNTQKWNMYSNETQPIIEHPKRSGTHVVLNDWKSWNLQCGAVTTGGRGRCRVKWSEGQNTLAWGQSARLLTCPHVGWWDFDAGRLISAKDYLGGILIPSPVCRQHDLSEHPRARYPEISSRSNQFCHLSFCSPPTLNLICGSRQLVLW